mmetsp:Transcript_20198/g.64263  ORF Transcript_20198/g.64263 Transcript_20198/m.64263 type:complete len:240 (-) Transcript_20198:199-918(-)
MSIGTTTRRSWRWRVGCWWCTRCPRPTPRTTGSRWRPSTCLPGWRARGDRRTVHLITSPLRLHDEHAHLLRRVPRHRQLNGLGWLPPTQLADARRVIHHHRPRGQLRADLLGGALLQVPVPALRSEHQHPHLPEVAREHVPCDELGALHSVAGGELGGRVHVACEELAPHGPHPEGEGPVEHKPPARAAPHHVRLGPLAAERQTPLHRRHGKHLEPCGKGGGPVGEVLLRVAALCCGGG